MNLVPFNTRRGLNSFEPFFGSMMKPFLSDFDMTSIMKVDVSENEKEYLMKVEVPGVNQEDLDIIVDDNTLTITAKRSEEKSEETNNYIRRERHSGTTTRSFNLNGVDENSIDASFDNGILTLTLPKLKESKPTHRRIELK